MENKTEVIAEDNKQELFVVRTFDLPVVDLFEAFVVPEYVEQWMGTKVEVLEAKRHGSWRFVTTDPMGNAHGFNGVFHDFVPNVKITRTFEMENSPLSVQIEYLEFEDLGNDTSKLTMHMVFKSIEMRNQLLKMPFAFGINMAHNRLQSIMNNKS